MNKSLVTILCFVLLLFSILDFAVGQQTCKDYYERSGVCVSLASCPSLARLDRFASFRDRLIIEGSSCPGPRINMRVCCADEGVSGSVVTRTSTTMRTTTTTTTQAPTRSRSNFLPVPGSSDCGLHTVNKIHGGKETGISEHPWLALLEYTWISGRKGFACGGFLINERYVVTAAHCIKTKLSIETPRLTGVRLGEWNHKTPNDCQTFGVTRECSDPPQDFTIEKMIIHPNYGAREVNQHNDIALIRLSTPAHFSNYVKPICLPLAQEIQDLTNFHDTQFIVAGWGYTENNVTSDTKLAVDVKGVEQARCQQTYDLLRRSIWDKQICAGGEKGKDSCGGDSGGPLMTTHADAEGNRYIYAAGLVSYGPATCGMEDVPGIYTRVGAYVDWIKEQMTE